MIHLNKVLKFARRRRADPTNASPMELHETTIMRGPEGATAGPSLAPRAEPEEDHLEDAFEDAIEGEGDTSTINLHDSLVDCERAINLFFNNELEGAIAIMKPWRKVSLYHAHGAAIFEFIPSLLTIEPAQIQQAHESLRQTFLLCNRQRRNYSFVQSIGAIIKKPNYGLYTEEEAHAELVHSEALLLSACLVALEGEDVTGFVKASMRVKSSYDGYKTCAKILEKKKNWESESSREHFESGIRLGLATFNVMIAMLPPKIVSVLEFVGFSADKEKGNKELLDGANSPGLRSILCRLTLLIYYLVIGQFAGIPPDFKISEDLINSGLEKFPNSIWFLMFKARKEMLSGTIEEAAKTYETLIHLIDMWPQLKHLTYWEMIWICAMMMKWSQAALFASLLSKESKWSKTIYLYTEAAMKLERGHLNSLEEHKQVAERLTDASCYRMKLLGRSLPMEKFIHRRCDRWAQRGYLVLPGVELAYLWNIFPSLGANTHYADRILKLIEQTREEIYKVIHSKYRIDANKRHTPEYDLDDVALVSFLRGSLLAAMQLPRLAIQHLEVVLKMKNDIKENTFLLPYATLEIAMCHYALKDPYRAIELLQEARKKYTGYLLESRLHFRIHAKLEVVCAGVPDTITAGPAAGAVAVCPVNDLAGPSTRAARGRSVPKTASENNGEGGTES